MTLRQFLISVCLVGLLLIGCARAEILPQDQAGNGPGAVDKVAAAETAEASATSTILIDYLADVEAAQVRWQAAGINSYAVEISYNEGQGGFQNFKVKVENGVVTSFQHTCTPERTCLKVKVDDEADFTIDGVLNSLNELGEQQIPLAILRLNQENGLPESVTTNSDEAPILRMYRIESFSPLELEK